MIAFIDTQLRELMAAANQLVPLDLRDTLLTQVADELGGKDLDDHLVHCVAYDVARGDYVGYRTGLFRAFSKSPASDRPATPLR
jgi:hypothetical protein